jgi:ribosomal protein S12 methylthiotransferase
VRVGVVTLGCDKNTVDSERVLAELAAHGLEPVRDMETAELIVVNTCGFIDAAKRESIDAIVEAGRLKSTGACRILAAVGCMVERHKGELADALPEVDFFLGTSEMDRLAQELTDRGALEGGYTAHPGVRLYSGDLPHVRYLKVSEGCDHGCAFCAIPLMRGKHRSFSRNEIVREAQMLEMQGAREVNLVAQDLAHYGRDVRDGVQLPDLLEMLLAETSIPWFRLLYIYSAGLTPRLLELMAREPRIVPYLDMPIQHGSDTVLARMRRPERSRTIRETVARVRAAVPDVAIRTTCILGFPGETPDDVAMLADLLEEARFERVGAFTYSEQEGTRAAELDDDVPMVEKRERLERVTELQRAITAERYEGQIGRTVRAIVDRPGEGRTLWQADDIDGITRLRGNAAPGAIVEVRIDEVVDDYDFAATVERVIMAPVAAPDAARSRALPVLSGVTNGSFGR